MSPLPGYRDAPLTQFPDEPTDPDEAEEFLDQPPDRARIAYLRLKGRVVENRLQDALEIGLRALDELGERVAADAGKPRMGNAVIRMKMTMRRWSNERLLELPHCEDERVIALHPILAELCNMAVLIRPNILPLLVRKQLDLTLAHGHTPSSPLVIAGYGIVLVLLGDYEGAQRFGEVGRALAALHLAGADYAMTRANALAIDGWRKLWHAARDRAMSPALAPPR